MSEGKRVWVTVQYNKRNYELAANMTNLLEYLKERNERIFKHISHIMNGCMLRTYIDVLLWACQLSGREHICISDREHICISE